MTEDQVDQVVERLRQAVRSRLAADRCNQREAARRSGVNVSVLCRFLKGQGLDVRAFVRLVAWTAPDAAGFDRA